MPPAGFTCSGAPSSHLSRARTATNVLEASACTGRPGGAVGPGGRKTKRCSLEITYQGQRYYGPYKPTGAPPRSGGSERGTISGASSGAVAMAGRARGDPRCGVLPRWCVAGRVRHSAPRASAPRRERGSARSRSTEAAAVLVRAGCSGQERPQQRASGSIVMAGRAYPRSGGTGGITVRCWCAVGETARLPRERQLARVESGRRGWHVL